MRRFFRFAHALNRLMRLSENERWSVVEAAFFLVYAKIAIITVPARTMMAMGRLDSIQDRFVQQTLELPAEIVAAVGALDRGSRHPLFANCLVRALALRLLLAHRGIPTAMHIGARKDEQGHFAAHAWLTYGDTILVGGKDAGLLYRELVGSSDAQPH